MTVSKIFTALFKDILTGMTIYGIGVAMAHGAFIDQSNFCDPTFCDPLFGDTNESK